jgi:hypothetical protein
MGINERLQSIIDEAFKGNKAAFSNQIGIRPTTLSNLVGKEKTSKPSSEILEKIIKNIPEINAEWLLTGEGELFKKKMGEKPDGTINQNEKGTNTATSGYSLYYYTTAETLLKILGDASTPRIKYSNFNNANDPKERTLYYRHFIKRGVEGAKKFLEENYKFISFCKHSSSNYYTGKGVTLPRMWSQYGTTQNKDGKDNQSYMNGACIELDFKKITSKKENNGGIPVLSFFDIEYKKEHELFHNIGDSNVSIEDDVKFKYKDWSDEQEFRALYKGDDNFFDISGCISRIYLGKDFRHENVVKLCNIMASKRHKDIHPFIFTRIMVSTLNGTLLHNLNIGGRIVDDMLVIIKKDYPKYYNELYLNHSEEHEHDFKNNIPYDFEKKLDEEQKKDEEKLRLDVEHWKNKYISMLEENRELNKEIREVSKEKDILNNEIKDALQKMIVLEQTIHSLEIEKILEAEKKNLLAELVSDVKDVLKRTGS